MVESRDDLEMVDAEVEVAQVATSTAEHSLPAHRCYEHRLL